MLSSTCTNQQHREEVLHTSSLNIGTQHSAESSNHTNYSAALCALLKNCPESEEETPPLPPLPTPRCPVSGSKKRRYHFTSVSASGNPGSGSASPVRPSQPPRGKPSVRAPKVKFDSSPPTTLSCPQPPPPPLPPSAGTKVPPPECRRGNPSENSGNGCPSRVWRSVVVKDATQQRRSAERAQRAVDSASAPSSPQAPSACHFLSPAARHLPLPRSPGKSDGPREQHPLSSLVDVLELSSSSQGSATNSASSPASSQKDARGERSTHHLGASVCHVPPSAHDSPSNGSGVAPLNPLDAGENTDGKPDTASSEKENKMSAPDSAVPQFERPATQSVAETSKTHQRHAHHSRLGLYSHVRLPTVSPELVRQVQAQVRQNSVTTIQQTPPSLTAFAESSSVAFDSVVAHATSRLRSSLVKSQRHSLSAAYNIFESLTTTTTTHTTADESTGNYQSNSESSLINSTLSCTMEGISPS